MQKLQKRLLCKTVGVDIFNHTSAKQNIIFLACFLSLVIEKKKCKPNRLDKPRNKGKNTTPPPPRAIVQLGRIHENTEKKMGLNCFAQTWGRWLLFQCHPFPSLASRHLAQKAKSSQETTSAFQLIGQHLHAEKLETGDKPGSKQTDSTSASDQLIISFCTKRLV